MEKRKVLLIVLYCVVVVAIGMFAINQTLNYFFKAQFLVTPCQLCEKVNEGVKCKGEIQSQYKINLTGEFVLPKP